ncbi:hypothetical protein JVU11DRAFT_8955 [Chiua virens]|nr:hypothetical protein JVU11DRAFT_8955 [Chiua virens]
MESVKATKGTGVVTSVPSDSPDDYMTTEDLRTKAEYYKVSSKRVAFEPVPVIETAKYSLSSKFAKNAKEIAYKEGFYSGTIIIIIGDFKGESVQDVKPKIRTQLIEKDLLSPTQSLRIWSCRSSADECVVALMDQWYMNYVELTLNICFRLLARMDTWTAETRNLFESILAWLNQWACARTHSLGSKMPWDPQFMVESLSDSTIYMAYYTCRAPAASITGHTVGPLGVTAQQMTDEAWDYIFCNGPWPNPEPFPREKADTMKHEFDYFYPFEIRSSGKDLVQNNLTFLLYNHVAIFPEDKWPLSIRTNGHLMLNGQKMSKSKGNSLTLREGIEKFGADAMRLTLADAGDGVEDANFDEKTGQRKHLASAHSYLDATNQNGGHGPRNYHDRVFEEEIINHIDITKHHYETTSFKDALKYGFYEFQNIRDWYRKVTADVGMHIDLVKYWIRTSPLLMAPFAEHTA